MGNCLVTKLKESVDNDNLIIFGKEKVYSLDKTNMGAAVAALDATGWRMALEIADNHSYFTVGISSEQLQSVDEFGPDGNTAISFVNTSGSLASYYLIDVFKSSGIRGIIENIDIMQPSEKIKYLWFEQSTLQDGIMHKSSGNIEKLGTNYPNLMICSLYYLRTVTGDITKAFGKCKDLTTLNIGNSPNISGSIESMANAMLLNGRENGTYVKITLNSVVTYHGSTFAEDTVKYLVFDNGSFDLVDTQPV